MGRQFSGNNSANVVEISCIFIKIEKKENAIFFLFGHHQDKL